MFAPTLAGAVVATRQVIPLRWHLLEFSRAPRYKAWATERPSPGLVVSAAPRRILSAMPETKKKKRHSPAWRSRQLSWRQELAVACPSCGAAVTVRCPGRRYSHPSRRKAAARLIQARVDKAAATRESRKVTRFFICPVCSGPHPRAECDNSGPLPDVPAYND